MKLKVDQIQNFDLNLLRLFRAIIETRSISRSARILGITQPAASNALRRLRDSLKDELFVQSPDGMLPTLFAEQFAQSVLPPLSMIVQSMTTTAEFDPETWEQTLKIGVTDYAVSTVMPLVLPRLMERAPHARIHQSVMRERNPHEDLVRGDLDFAIGSFTKEPPSFYQKKIRQESFVVIVRKGHPLATKNNWNLQSYAAARHLLIAPWGSPWGAVDEVLAEKKLSRVVALTVPYFSSAPVIVSQTDLVSTVPKGLAYEWSQTYPIVILETPVPVPRFGISLLWHKRTHKSVSHEWIRREIMSLAK